MTSTTDQYWIIFQTYHGDFCPSICDNKLFISSAPLFRGNEIHFATNDTDYAQYGPYDNIKAAMQAANQYVPGTWLKNEWPDAPSILAPELCTSIVAKYMRREHRPIRISIDNNRTFLTADELFENEQFLAKEGSYWTEIKALMEDEAREQAFKEFGRGTKLEFLRRYCELADYGISIEPF